MNFDNTIATLISFVLLFAVFLFGQIHYIERSIHVNGESAPHQIQENVGAEDVSSLGDASDSPSDSEEKIGGYTKDELLRAFFGDSADDPFVDLWVYLPDNSLLVGTHRGDRYTSNYGVESLLGTYEIHKVSAVESGQLDLDSSEIIFTTNMDSSPGSNLDWGADADGLVFINKEDSPGEAFTSHQLLVLDETASRKVTYIEYINSGSSVSPTVFAQTTEGYAIDTDYGISLSLEATRSCVELGGYEYVGEERTPVAQDTTELTGVDLFQVTSKSEGQKVSSFIATLPFTESIETLCPVGYGYSYTEPLLRGPFVGTSTVYFEVQNDVLIQIPLEVFNEGDWVGKIDPPVSLATNDVFCSEESQVTDIGRQKYSVYPKYKSFGTFGEFVTAQSCDAERVEMLFGVENGFYTGGVRVRLKNIQARGLEDSFREIGLRCDIESGATCKDWVMADPISMEEAQVIASFDSVIESVDCISCG